MQNQNNTNNNMIIIIITIKKADDTTRENGRVGKEQVEEDKFFSTLCAMLYVVVDLNRDVDERLCRLFLFVDISKKGKTINMLSIDT